MRRTPRGEMDSRLRGNDGMDAGALRAARAARTPSIFPFHGVTMRICAVILRKRGSIGFRFRKAPVPDSRLHHHCVLSRRPLAVADSDSGRVETLRRPEPRERVRHTGLARQTDVLRGAVFRPRKIPKISASFAMSSCRASTAPVTCLNA